MQRGELPEKSRDIVWGCLIGHTMDRMVEGLSRVKKCSARGRVLMKADVDDCFNHARGLVDGVLRCARARPAACCGVGGLVAVVGCGWRPPLAVSERLIDAAHHRAAAPGAAACRKGTMFRDDSYVGEYILAHNMAVEEQFKAWVLARKVRAPARAARRRRCPRVRARASLRLCVLGAGALHRAADGGAGGERHRPKACAPGARALEGAGWIFLRDALSA